MRTSLFVLAALLAAPMSLPGQGQIIVDVCIPEQPCPPRPPCRIRPCPPWPAPRTSAIERTSSDVRVELVDRVLRYEVEEVFINRGGAVGEADYLFPLPAGAAFQDLKLSIDGELVAGETLNAAEARRIYEEIVRRQRDPALVEWMGQGLLRTRIFPFAPGEERRIVVRFQSVASREGDALRVDYFRGARRPLDGITRERARTSFVLTYPDQSALGTPYSPTHQLDVRRSEQGRVRVDVRGDARDVALLLPVRQHDSPAISVLTHAPRRNEGFALITLTPPAIASSRQPRDVTFVLDVSGSMSGRKMDQARAAGKQLLATLRPGDRFRLIDFATDVRSFRDGYVDVTRANLDAAERYLDALDASGSTNISGALDEALAEPPVDGRFSVVLFVTDGQPTVGERDPAAIASRAAKLRGSRRVFSFGLGSDVNVSLIEQLALEGRGTAHFVRPDESVERSVSIVASRLSHPVATNLRLRTEGVRLERVHPVGPVDLFAGEDLIVLARYAGSGEVRLAFEGETATGRVRWTSTASFPERASENGFVPRLWATQRVGYLSAEKRKHGGSSEIDDEIRELGERYGIPTEFTSYFVREPGMVAERRRGIGQDGAVQLSGVVVAEPSRAAAFDAAKTAAAQRAVRSVADADSIAAMAPSSRGQPGSDVRRFGDRLFEWRDSIWVDLAHRPDLRVVRVRPFSDAYFGLLQAMPELKETMSLGARVIVAGRTVAIEVTPDGVETLTARELSRIRAEW